jgi:hypothetical protein
MDNTANMDQLLEETVHSGTETNKNISILISDSFYLHDQVYNILLLLELREGIKKPTNVQFGKEPNNAVTATE